ncbi:MAG: toxin HicA [Acidobacteria bacterium]|nr:toxin HicA [Acidobacteriota bacterium]
MELKDAITELTAKEKTIRFTRLKTICEKFFGSPRINGSHHIFNTGQREQPTVNFQNRKGKVRFYQVRQVREALERMLQQEEQ